MLIPFLGVVLSLATFAIGPALAPRVWPQLSPRAARWLTALAVAAFLVPIALSLTGIPLLRGSAWLLIPLCGPADVVGWVAPPGIAILVYTVGCVLAISIDRPWIWPVAAFVSVTAYDAAMQVLDANGYRFVC